MNLSALISGYQTDPDSPFHKNAWVTRQNYLRNCERIGRDFGAVELSDINARLLLRWHESWGADGKVAMGHALIGMLRTLMTFGATLLESDECRRVKTILHDMRFTMPQPRKERMTADQASAIRAEAHRLGRPSIALAQACQYEFIWRQKDVIGEYVPVSEPRPSDLVVQDVKWVAGVRWPEIDDNWTLRHVTNKRKKEVEINILLAPMVVEELRLLAGIGPQDELLRCYFPWSPPLILNEATGLPYRDHQFRRLWRAIARSAGVPDEVFNMDSRAGAISEGTDAGADLEMMRHAATHSDIKMTARYSRGSADKIKQVQLIRAAHREKAA